MEENKRNLIDELFRNKLNEDQLVSEDSLWEEVEGIMDNRKKKKRFLILMWTLLLVGICTTGYLLLPNKAGKSSYAVVTSQSSISSQNSASNQTVNANSAGSNVAGTKEGSGSGSASNSTSSSSIVSTPSKNAVNPNDNLNTTSSANNAAGRYSSASSTNAYNLSVSSKKHKKAIPIAQPVSATPASQNGSLTNGAVDKTISTGAKPDSTTNNSSVGATINANSYLKGNATSSEDELVDTSEKKPAIAQSDELTKPKKPTHKSLTKLYVELDGAYIDNFHFVSAPTNANPNYDNIRGSDERPIFTPNYMLKVGVVRKNIQFNTGLGITNVGEKIEYKNHDDSTGNTIIRNDSVFARNGSFVNTYLTVPLQVTFLFPVKGVRFQLGFGTDAFFPLKWNSYYLNKQVDELEDPGSLKMVNNVVLNLNVNLGLQVPFTRHWSGIASLEFSRDLSNVFKSSYGIRQEYLGVGGNLGIRYSFAR